MGMTTQSACLCLDKEAPYDFSPWWMNNWSEDWMATSDLYNTLGLSFIESCKLN